MIFVHLLPELILFIGAITLLMIDVFLGKKLENPAKSLFTNSLLITISALIWLIYSYGNEVSIFSDTFAISKFSSFSKIIIIILLIGVITISRNFINFERKIGTEFMALIMISTCGAMILMSASDFITFYLALELQSLPLYILAAMKGNSSKSAESGMKYFLLGSVSSGILLLGISYIYGFTGTTNFNDLLYLMNQTNISLANDPQMLDFPFGLLLGLMLVFVAALFKISAAPFHMWAPDVYEGAPTNVTSFFASVIKFTMILITVKIYAYIIYSWSLFYQVLILIAILSLLVGCFGALKQQNLKRMLAYSSIGHVGFMMAGLAATNFESLKAVILYAVIYSSLSIGSFALLILLINKNAEANEDKNNDKIYKISSLAGISKTNPMMALCLTILMFSMAGIPPMAGFFAKFYILLSIVKQKLYFLAILAVMTSIVSAFYYLRIVKTMYFDVSHGDVEVSSRSSATIVLFFAVIFNLFFIALSKPLLSVISHLFN